MLTARQVDFWGRSYEIVIDGTRITTFSPKRWSAGGRFTLDAQDYELRSNMWGSDYVMIRGDETPVASASRVGRKNWTVEVDGRTYRFQRVSFWKGDQALLADGHQAGVVRRTSTWKMNATAELPGLPLPVRVFVLVVVLTMWRTQAAAAGAAAAGGGA